MAEITAKMVADLRTKTGCGMMECKKALNEANGDFDEAIKLLREKAEVYTNERASSFIRRRELKSTGVFWSDWAVYVNGVDDAYILAEGDKKYLSSKISADLRNEGLGAATELRDKFLSFFRSCSDSVIKECSTEETDDELFMLKAHETPDFCRICKRESDCQKNEDEIKSNLLSIFPGEFEEMCSQKVKDEVAAFVAKVYGQAQGTFLQRLDDCYRLIEQIREGVLAFDEAQDRGQQSDQGEGNNPLRDILDWGYALWQKHRTRRK